MKKTCFTDICTLIMGQSPDSSSYNTNYEGLPFYQGNSDFGELHPVPRVWCSESKKIAQENDILISVRAPIGDLNIANEKCCIGRGLAAIRIINSDNVDLTYLYHFFESKRTYLQEKGTGSTFKAINKDSLINFVIPLPSIKEQESISQELSALHLLIKGKKTQLFALDELVKSRFIEMFGDCVNNTKGWGAYRLNDVCDVRDGTHDSPEYYSIGTPLITSKNISSGCLEFSNVNYISEEDAKLINKRSKVDYGDILLPMIGTVGGAVIVDIEPNFCIKNVALIKFTKSNIKNVFVREYLNSDAVNNVFENVKNGGTQKFVGLGTIRNLTISVPPIELQNEFAEFVKLIDKSKFIVQQQIKDLQELLDSKMDEYFR